MRLRIEVSMRIDELSRDLKHYEKELQHYNKMGNTYMSGIYLNKVMTCDGEIKSLRWVLNESV